ncbi:MAG TPA: hypothetical protein VGR69_07870 [Candidatus Rubrimentiphilum sp.]|nr:hypothetical protein [Candidatus Rubrimentiphilum sp.]
MYDPTDERGVPVSRGVPAIVRVAAVIGILVIFAVGAAVVSISGYGHHWPWASAMRIPLSNPR